mgnify:CR=1 FL=1
MDFIATEAARGVVYVHCKIGYSRSAAVVGAYLLASATAATVEDVVARLRKVRPSIVIRAEAMAALHAFAARVHRHVSNTYFGGAGKSSTGPRPLISAK